MAEKTETNRRPDKIRIAVMLIISLFVIATGAFLHIPHSKIRM